MNNIKTADDVCAWAQEIVEAQGNKYTPLSKGDLLVIAQFIMNYVSVGQTNTDNPPPEQDAQKDNSTVEIDVSSPSTIPLQDSTTNEDAGGENDGATDKPDNGKYAEIQMITRGQLLHREGCAVQQAYDKFLQWSNNHPKESHVMDFSTGVRSNNAAFAYWLAEAVPVKSPCISTIPAAPAK